MGVTQISNSLTEGVDVNVEVYKTKEDFLLWLRYNTNLCPQLVKGILLATRKKPIMNYIKSNFQRRLPLVSDNQLAAVNNNRH